MTERNWQDDIKVDKYNLDAEYELHPSIYMHWAEKAVEAHIAQLEAAERLKVVKAETKKELDELRAEIDGDIRINFEKYGFDKRPTESAISNTILVTLVFKEKEKVGVEKVGEVTDAWIKSVRDEGIMDEARRSMAFKKSSIEGLERLVLREYYPRFSKDVKEPLEKVTKEKMSNALDERMKVRRRRSKDD